jgi:hypothetical protein
MINLYPDYTWKQIYKAPHRAIINKAIQTYAKLEWGSLCPAEPPTHQGLYLGDGLVFDVTWPVARVGDIGEFLGDRRFKVFRFNTELDDLSSMRVRLLMKQKAREIEGTKYDWLDLGGFLAHALFDIIGWPAVATKILPIIFGKNWKLAPFEVLGIGQKCMVCSVGVAAIMVAVHEIVPEYPRPFFVESPGDLDVESHGDWFRAVECIDPSCVEIWDKEFSEVK